MTSGWSCKKHNNNKASRSEIITNKVLTQKLKFSVCLLDKSRFLKLKQKPNKRVVKKMS